MVAVDAQLQVQKPDLSYIGLQATDLGVLLADPAVTAALASILAKLGAVTLDAPTLAALETISVSNFPADFPDAAVLAKVEAVRVLLAATLTITGTVAVLNFPATQPVSGPLTDTQLRATPVPVSGTVTVTDGSGPLTVDGSVAVTNFPATQPVSGPLTDAQLRAAAVVVSAVDLDVRNLALTQDSVRQTQRPMSSYVDTLAAPQTDAIAAAITSPDRIRVLRLDGGSRPNNPADSFVTVTINVGGVAIFSKMLQVGEPIGGQVCIEGAAGDDLTITMTGTGSVDFNLRYEAFQ